MRIRPSHLGAGALAGAATLYLVLSLAAGHSARSELPPDLSIHAADAGLDVWRAAALLLGGGVLVDVRAEADFRRYHPPGALHAEDAGADRLRALAREHGAVVAIDAKDAAAQARVGAARAADPGGRYYFLQDGARAWYLALELPVPLFSEAPAPYGYEEAVATVRRFFAAPSPGARGAALEAVQALARWGYQPGLLKSSKQAAPAGGRKKIAGGCGG